MSYAVKETLGTFNIVEKNTNTNILLNTDEKIARDICRKLNLGGGFSGWTPSFFANFVGHRNHDN